MTALEQLAEREYPISANSAENTLSVLIQGEKRLAFIRGAKLAEEFMLWIDNKSPALATAWADTFEIFLTEKLKSDEHA